MSMTSLEALIGLDREAVADSLRALDTWSPSAAHSPTPCTGWDLSDLLAHMTVQQRGFATAVAGGRTTLADWEPRYSADPLDEYRAACAEVLAAFAAIRDPGAPVYLPEIRDEPVPAATAIGFHLVDNVVHAWDAAVSLGVRLTFDDDVAEAALAVARQVPDGPERDRPNAVFAPSRPAEESASALETTLLFLGRDPDWSAE
jgi:uncharacterized protein (TIGR03086 family)